jgi:ATP-dependent RNA helicase DDX46/PRP5
MAERLAKLEAWKKKQAEERERKLKEQKELEGAVSARSLLEEIDKRAAGATVALEPQPARSPPPPSPVQPASQLPQDENPPAAYAGKFDPKAIAKKAAASAPTGATTLGRDVALPDVTKTSATLTPSATRLKADSSTASTSSSTGKREIFGLPPP